MAHYELSVLGWHCLQRYWSARMKELKYDFLTSVVVGNLAHLDGHLNMVEPHHCMVDRRPCMVPELPCMVPRHLCMMVVELHIMVARHRSMKAVPLLVEAVPGILLMLIHPTGKLQMMLTIASEKIPYDLLPLTI